MEKFGYLLCHILFFDLPAYKINLKYLDQGGKTQKQAGAELAEAKPLLGLIFRQARKPGAQNWVKLCPMDN